MDGTRDLEMPVKCFTCPRERRGSESGWYFVDLHDRLRAPGPARIFVCPRHYGHFAAQERGRWIELIEPMGPTSATWIGPAGTPAEREIGGDRSCVLMYDGQGDAIASK